MKMKTGFIYGVTLKPLLLSYILALRLVGTVISVLYLLKIIYFKMDHQIELAYTVDARKY